MARPKKNPAKKDGAQTAPLRKDPPSRSVRGPFQMAGLRNARADMCYVWVNPLDPDGGIEHYSSMGYTVEHKEAGGVATAGGITVKPGEEIKYRGQVLMSIHKDEKARINEFGAEGDPGNPRSWSGQRGEDEREKRYILKRGQVDPMRGIRSLLGVLDDGINASLGE